MARCEARDRRGGQLTDRNNITVWTNCYSLGPGLAALWNNLTSKGTFAYSIQRQSLIIDINARRPGPTEIKRAFISVSFISSQHDFRHQQGQKRQQIQRK